MEEYPTIHDLIQYIEREAKNRGKLHSVMVNDPGDGVPPVFHAHVEMDGSEFILSIIPTNLDGSE